MTRPLQDLIPLGLILPRSVLRRCKAGSLGSTATGGQVRLGAWTPKPHLLQHPPCRGDRFPCAAGQRCPGFGIPGRGPPKRAFTVRRLLVAAVVLAALYYGVTVANDHWTVGRFLVRTGDACLQAAINIEVPRESGDLSKAFSWHWLFLVSVPPGILVAIATWTLIDFDKPDLMKQFDWIGMFGMAAMLGALGYVLEERPGVPLAGLAMFFIAPISGMLASRVEMRRMLIVGLLGFGTSTWLLNGMTADWDFAELMAPQIRRGLSLMVCLVPINNPALGTLPSARLKNASGLYNLTRNLGGAVPADNGHARTRCATRRRRRSLNRAASGFSQVEKGQGRSGPCAWRAACQRACISGPGTPNRGLSRQAPVPSTRR